MAALIRSILKFLEIYRKDILTSFEVHGFSKDNFCFTKRKGRIITEHHDSKFSFSYYDKKETRLDEITKRWVHSSQFEIKVNIEKTKWVENWDKVLEHFAQWLNKLKLT